MLPRYDSSLTYPREITAFKFFFRGKWRSVCAINLLSTNNSVNILSRDKHAKYIFQIANKNHRFAHANQSRETPRTCLSRTYVALYCDIHIIVLRYDRERWKGKPIEYSNTLRSASLRLRGDVLMPVDALICTNVRDPGASPRPRVLHRARIRARIGDGYE